MKLFFISLLTLTDVAMAFSLQVDFENLKNDKGSIRYLLFDKAEGYPDQNKLSLKEGSIDANKAQAGLKIDNLPEGTYSFSVIHDENNNNKLDTNFLGIPKEGFGFSNNPAILFGPPSFSKSKFEVKSDTTIKIKMKYF